MKGLNNVGKFMLCDEIMACQETLLTHLLTPYSIPSRSQYVPAAGNDDVHSQGYSGT